MNTNTPQGHGAPDLPDDWWKPLVEQYGPLVLVVFSNGHPKYLYKLGGGAVQLAPPATARRPRRGHAPRHRPRGCLWTPRESSARLTARSA